MFNKSEAIERIDMAKIDYYVAKAHYERSKATVGLFKGLVRALSPKANPGPKAARTA